MKTTIVRANERSSVNHGWLKVNHTFSFADYYNPDRIRFGLLRVFNDDFIEPSMGFPPHPHDNMEIVTIILEGSLHHKDSMGNSGVIKPGEVQIMSAGTGVQHSEYNASPTERSNVLQTWIFPKERDITPRYDQLVVNQDKLKNQLFTFVSPDKSAEGAVWINQDAYYSMGKLDAGTKIEYQPKHAGNGVWVFIINGSAKIAGEVLNKRDSMGVWEYSNFEIEVTENTELMLIDVPMN